MTFEELLILESDIKDSILMLGKEPELESNSEEWEEFK